MPGCRVVWVKVRPTKSKVGFTFANWLAVTMLRYTLYPATIEVLAFQDSATEWACCAVAVKFTPGTFAVLIVTFWLAGVNVYPVSLGVTVYAPTANPAKE